MFESVEKFFKNKKAPISFGHDIRELTGCHGAILSTDGFEQSELFEPKAALERAGAIMHVVSLRPGKIKAWKDGNWGKTIDVDMTVREAWSMEFDFLVLPGGVLNPDKLRNNAEAVAFVMSFVNKHRPIAAICHGVQTLIETGALKGKKLTSWPSLKTDLINAGADWVDKEVVIDHKIITSRKPSDIPAFNDAIIREFTYGRIHSHLPNTEGYVTTL
jgi:protease I